MRSSIHDLEEGMILADTTVPVADLTIASK